MPKTSIQGTTLHYHVQGSGIPIVFIHPPLLNRAIFRYQEVQLSDMFRVITFDIRGHGFSPASPATLTYSLIVQDIIGLLDFLDIKHAYLCGYSTGAGVALEALLTHENRFRGAILIGGMSEMGDWIARSQIHVASFLATAGMKTTLALCIAAGNADRRETFHNLYYEAMQGDVNNWRQYYDASAAYSCTDRLQSIQSPILLVSGMNDVRFQKYSDLLQQKLPKTSHIHIPGVSHSIPTKAPELLHAHVSQWVMNIESMIQSKKS
jgi:pimeloyl-ACP methyl ester carboxylesterase